MQTFMLLSTAWGPKHGGINAFNLDFACGLAKFLGERGRVFCGVLTATQDEQDFAKNKCGVTLVPIGRPSELGAFDRSWAFEVWEEFRKLFPHTSIDWWVGHDVTSGNTALKGPQIAGAGRTALIMHMRYLDYQGLKHGDAVEAVAKDRQQRELFNAPGTALFAVGPLLRDELAIMVGRGDVTMLVPGFPEFPARAEIPVTRLTLITFGRLDAVSDRIKQGVLALEGFATACREAYEDATRPKLLRNFPRFYLIGIGAKEEVSLLTQRAQSIAGGATNVFALPFDENRDELFRKITGGFRSGWGAQIHAGYRSVTGTARLHGQTPLNAIGQLLGGTFEPSPAS